MRAGVVLVLCGRLGVALGWRWVGCVGRQSFHGFSDFGPAPPVHPALELPFTPGFVCTSVGPDCPAAKVRSWVAAVGVVLVVVGVCALLASQGDLPLPFRDLSLPFLVVSLPFHVLSVTFHCLSSWPFTAFSTALPRPVTAF